MEKGLTLNLYEKARDSILKKLFIGQRSIHLEDVLLVLDLSNDPIYEHVEIKHNILEISMPTGKSETFIDEQTDTPSTNYLWGNATYNFNLPFEEQSDNTYQLIIDRLN